MNKPHLSCGVPPQRDIVDIARCAESLGYDRFWTYDSPALYGDLWIALARVAEQTERIGIGSGVAVASLRHVMVTASAIAAIHELAPGRLVCGFGTGFTGRKTMGQKPATWAFLKRYIQQLRALLAGETVEVDGAPCQMIHSPGFAPPRPIDVPLLLAPMGPKGIAVSREVADGILIPYEPVEGFDPCVVVMSGTVLDPGEDHTTPRVREAAGPWFTSMYHAAWDQLPEAVDGLPGGAEWRRRIEAERPEGERHLVVHEGHVEVVPERERFLLEEAGPLLTEMGWTGDAASVRVKIDAAVEGGATEIAYMAAGPDIPRELEAFARGRWEVGVTRTVESRTAFRELLALLAEIDEEWIGEARGITESTVHLAHRSLAMVLWGALDFYLEADFARPRLSRITSPVRKWSDNPDAVYFFAPLDGDHSYRIRGVGCGEVYLNFTVHRGDRDGHWPSGVAADLDMRDMKFDADGSYEVVLSSKEQPGNWLRLEPDAGSVVVRLYFENETPAAADPALDPRLVIEPLHPPSSAPASPSDAEVAARLRRVANWVRTKAGYQVIPAHPRRLPAWYSAVPNTLGPPIDWSSEQGGGWGAVDAAYSAGDYDLAPDEALIVEGRLPEGVFSNVVLWNPLGQTEDYRHRQVSLNRRQMTTDAEGRYRIVVAHSDPGVPNWLDTAGHGRGTIYWRFLLPEEPPETPVCRVVPVADVAS